MPNKMEIYVLYILDTKIAMEHKWKAWLPAAFYNLDETGM